MNFKSSLFSALAFSVAVFAAADNPLKLWYNSDAGGEFTNALPIGNGYMGGLIYGGVTKDVIGLNESTVWSGGPGDNNKQGAASHLKDARDAMFRGDYKTAESIVSNYMIGPGPASFQPVGDLVITTSHNGAGITAANSTLRRQSPRRPIRAGSEAYPRIFRKLSGPCDCGASVCRQGRLGEFRGHDDDSAQQQAHEQ